jgi:hypothetical protein
MAGKVEELYIKVVARAGEAKKELENLRKAGEKAQKPLQDEVNKLKTRLQLRDSYLNKTKEEQKQVRELLKLEGRRVLNEKEAVKAQEKIAKLTDHIVANNKELESSKQYKTIKDQTDQLDKQAKQIEILNERRKAGLQDYIEFTKRASSENGRFADRLDRRDRTRSMSENLRRGMEKGTAISQRWHAEENSVYRLERSLGIASTAFDKVRHPAEALTDNFYRLQRVGYAMQTVFGVAAGTIGDLGGGFMALIGVAGAAAGSLAAVAGAMANLGAGMMVAKFALSGVGAAVQQLWSGQNAYNKSLRDAKKAFRDLRFEAEDAALSEQEAAIALEKARENLARVQDLPADSRARREAELEYQRADLNYRRAKARVNDANKALKKGPASNPAQNPFNNLTKSQIVFAKYLATLKPVVQSLKESAASSFLPPLQKSIQVLVTNLVPALKDGLNSVGEALGDASRNFTDAFKDKGNIKLFREFLENSKPTIRILGAVANKVFGGILVFLKAAQPITDRFARWVFSVADGFEKWSKNGGEDKLKKFFKLAGDVAASLGDAFKFVFGGLSNIVKATFPNGANSGAGGVILEWLKEIGAGFKLFTGTNEFSGWLKSATENSKIALSTIGQFLKIFIDMAGNPANKEFWTIIQGAVPYVRKILEDGQKAGPAFGNLLVAIAELVSKFSEATAMKIFFTTLQLSANVISNFITAAKPLLDVLGAAHGIFLALVVVGALFRRVIQIMMGIMMKFLRVVGSVTTTFQNFRGKLAAAKADGAVGFKGILDSLRQMKIEMTNLKRIEFLKDVAKGERAKQISAIKDKMGQLNLRTKQGREEAKKYQNEIESINRSYKKLRAELELNGKAAKNWGQLVESSAQSAKFKLDQFAATQDKMAKWGRIGGRVGAGALAVGTAYSALQSGQGGIGAGISAVGAGLSFLPGVGMLAGIGTSIVGSIVSGFEQANAEKKAQEEQKKIEIKAKFAEIRTENLNQTRTGLGALVGEGRDIVSAQGTFDKIQEAAKSSLKQSKVKGVTDTALTNALLTSDSLRSLVADTKTRAAVLKTATRAAASGIYSDTVTNDDGTTTTTINLDKVVTAMTEALEGTGTSGGVKGIAGIDDLFNRLSKGRYVETGDQNDPGKVLATKAANKFENTQDQSRAIAMATAYLTPEVNKLQAELDKEEGKLKRYKNPAKIISLKKQIEVLRENMRIGEGFFQDLYNPLRPKTVYGPFAGPAAPGKPSAEEIALRKAAANMGRKPTEKEKDLIPKPTSTFYDKSLKKNQTMIEVLQEIRDNIKPPTTSTTYGPFLTGVIP